MKQHIQSTSITKELAEKYTGLKFKQQETGYLTCLEYKDVTLWCKNLIRLTADINRKIWKQSKVTVIVDDYLLNLFKQISSFSKDGSHDEDLPEVVFKKGNSNNKKLGSHQLMINNSILITMFEPFETKDSPKTLTKQSIKKDGYYPTFLELYQINQLLDKQ